MNTNHDRAMGRAMRALAATALLAVPAMPALAAESAAAEQERRTRELEERVRQEDARREMESRVRQQEEAIRRQQESIRRLEDARERLERNSREVAELSSQLGRNYTWNFSTSGGPPRALLGVSVDNAGGRDGALVRNVSPGGAAEAAGIKAGDLITAIDGADLTRDSDPARALVERMGDVKADARVKVDVLRDGRKMSFDVTARAAPQLQIVSPEQFARLGELRQRYTDNHPEVRRMVQMFGEPGQGLVFNYEGANRFGGMEFATVSDRLGDYFGVDSGVLVVRAGADAPYGLQDGDVILAVDGRAPNDAQHAGRILRSYQPGEKVKLRVQRDRKAIDLNATAPGARDN